LAIVSAYDVVIEHLDCSKNLTDGASRPHYYEFACEMSVARLLTTVSIEQFDELVPGIIAAQASDPLAVDLLANHVNRPMIHGTDIAKEESQWKVIAGILT
jgi:hypothetical protein